MIKKDNLNFDVINLEGNINNNVALFAVTKLEKDSTFIIVLENKEDCKNYADFLKSNTSGIDVIYLNSWESEPYSFIYPNVYDIGNRLKAIHKIIENKKSKRIVICDIKALLQKFNNNLFYMQINKGDDISFSLLSQTLVQNGYKRVDEVIASGDFCIRGDIVDIFPSDSDTPYRIDFFGDTIEKIKKFDQISQRTISEVNSFELYGANEIVLNDNTIEKFKANYLENLKDSSSKFDDLVYNNVSNKINSLNFLNFLPLFSNYKLNNIFDILDKNVQFYLPFNFEIYINNIEKKVEENKEAFNINIKSDDLYLDKRSLFENLKSFKIYSNFLKGDKKEAYPFDNIKDIEKLRILGRENLFNHIKNISSTQNVILNLYSDTLTSEMNEKLGFPVVENLDFTKAVKGNYILKGNFFNSSFDYFGVPVYTENDLTGQAKKQTYAKLSKHNKGKSIIDFNEIEIDDYLVHYEHGIGQFKGIKNMDLHGKVHDLIQLQYANSTLFIPIENLDMLNRYGSKENLVALDNIGTSAWQERRARLKNKLKYMAEKLVRVAAKRLLAKIPVYQIQSEDYTKFLNEFEYLDTPDQVEATKDIEEDFAKGIPADRLLCADVGFGKTEIAMRACFLNYYNNFQSVVIAPTTLLVEQHFKSFKKRFASFKNIKIAKLSRLTPYGEAKKIKADLKAGKVDIVIGTHSLLAKTIEIQSLGLIVIDEEQNFGVAHKERLKNDYFNSHVLTLTATPIPRTLSLSFSGLKDLTVMSTPPIKRHSVITQLVQWNTNVIKDAVILEKTRNGQVFFVAPRIADLNIILSYLKDILPEIRIAVAHGQMAGKSLEKVMEEFADYKYDVLLSTSIVESGLDLERVNTIFIYRADNFGLASLYQLRGRVGRRDRQAYCYLSYLEETQLSVNAIKRLELINSLSSLGDSFKLASHDLDIRGAGNLLGEEQSGFIKEVGIELYQKMLETEVTNIKNKLYGNNDSVDDIEEFTTKIKLDESFLIPSFYIENSNLRLNMYQKFSNAKTGSELEELREELKDRFGDYPKEVENLFRVFEFKLIANSFNITELEINKNIASVSFYKNEPLNPEALLQKIYKFANVAKITNQNKLIYTSKKANSFEVLADVLEFIKI